MRELVAALDAMPVKELESDSLRYEDGSVCALGAVAAARGVDVSPLDPYDIETVAHTFGIAPAMTREVVYENDEGGSYSETPAQRWQRMRRWAEASLRTTPPSERE
jgi:hypothetical protein